MQQRHKKSSKKPLLRNVRFSPRTLIFFVVVMSIAGYFLIFGRAAPPPPTVYLSPASAVVAANGSFAVQVRENSSTTAVNAVQANFTYPSSLLSCTGSTATPGDISLTGTAFGTTAETTCGSGQVKIGLGVACSGTCTGVTGDQLVATVTFHSNPTGGNAAMTFNSGTALVNATTNLDILGSLSATAGGTYTVDVNPPTATLTAPANGATLAYGNNITVSATATDAESSVSKVDVYTDGSLKATLTTSPYNYTWSGATLGTHTVQVKATDAAGNVGSSTTASITVADQTPPSTPGTFKASSTGLTSITLTWLTSTDNVGVTGYVLTRGGTTIATLSSATLTYTDSGLSTATTYSYTITATDAAGNSSTPASLSVATLTPKLGDINLDGLVNIVDLSILLSNYNTTSAPSDLNHDGIVNIFDLSILLSNYGK